MAGVFLQKHDTLWAEYQANLSPKSSGQRQVIQQLLLLLFLVWRPWDRTRPPTVSRCHQEDVAFEVDGEAQARLRQKGGRESVVRGVSAQVGRARSRNLLSAEQLTE